MCEEPGIYVGVLLSRASVLIWSKRTKAKEVRQPKSAKAGNLCEHSLGCSHRLSLAGLRAPSLLLADAPNAYLQGVNRAPQCLCSAWIRLLP
jgi:hypothetical protein